MKSIHRGSSLFTKEGYQELHLWKPLAFVDHPVTKLTTKPWVCHQCRQYSKPTSVSGISARPFEKRAPSRLSRLQRDQSRRYEFSSSVRKALDNEKNPASGEPRQDLPSQAEGRRSHLSKRFNHVMDHLQSNIFIAGQRLNDLTGYSGIEALKKDIEEQEELVQSSRKALQVSREAYTKAISQRSASQREVNELLQRKHAWTPNDLERFTELYRSDHANEQAETAAQEQLLKIERRAEDAGARLSACILARYHEEQIWSDKIRRMSTWGTWGLMGINILLFVVFQIGVEPWRRRRLVKGFEEKVMEALEREGSGKDLEKAALATKNTEDVTAPDVTAGTTHPSEVAEPVPEDTPLDWEPVSFPRSLSPELPNPITASRLDRIKKVFRDLFSEQEIIVRRKDLTNAMLEGTAAGIAIVGVVVLILRPH